MAQVKFYRGEIGTSLPNETIDGAIFIVERDNKNNLGDIYVDMEVVNDSILNQILVLKYMIAH